MNDITHLLEDVRNGGPQASANLFAVLYDELKRLAVHQMRNESASHTLQPTALIHEAFLRLLKNADSNWENRAHFFGAAAEAMRRILIDAARSKACIKRGGRRSPESLKDELSVSDPIAIEILDVNDSISVLEKQDAELAEIVKLRFFGGLAMEQIAEIKGQSKSSIERRWAFAKAWLVSRLSEDS